MCLLFIWHEFLAFLVINDEKSIRRCKKKEDIFLIRITWCGNIFIPPSFHSEPTSTVSMWSPYKKTINKRFHCWAWLYSNWQWTHSQSFPFFNISRWIPGLCVAKQNKLCIPSPRNIDAFDTSQKQKRALNNSLCLVLTHAIGCSPKKKKEKGISLDFINPTLSEIEGCLLHFRFSLNETDLDVVYRFFRSDRFWFLGLFSTRI